jgi:hypothetical protein
MTLVNFEVELNSTPAFQNPVIPAVRAIRSRIDRATDQWDWRGLRDYVMARIEDRHGRVERDSLKEASVFKSFLKRWGDVAPDIARYALEDCGGQWNGRPVTMTSFCKGSDPYFGALIAERLRR